MATDYGKLGYPKDFITPLNQGPDPSDTDAPPTGNMGFGRDTEKGPADPMGLVPSQGRGGK